MKPVMFSSVFSCRRVPADCSLPVAPDTFDLVLGGGGGVPIGMGEFHVYAVAASFHTLCMLHPQHVGGSSEAAMVRSHLGLEARASLFGLFDRNPPPHTDNRLVMTVGQQCRRGFWSTGAHSWPMQDAWWKPVSLSTRGSSRTNYILGVQRFSRSLLLFLFF